MRPWCEGNLLISDAARVFDREGRVADGTRERIGRFVSGFPAFVAGQPRRAELRSAAVLSAATVPTGSGSVVHAK
jgi:hypothetical protein